MHFSKKRIQQVIKLGTTFFFVVALFTTLFNFISEVQTVHAASTAAGGLYTATDTGTMEPTKTGSIDQAISQLISNVVYVFTVGLASSVAYVAAYFLNFSVYISLNSTAYALDFLSLQWEVVRNMANMGFIFILIYIAITIILTADTGKTMSLLARVIGIALIINFSFFFVRVVIDMGNIVAINFYNGIHVNTVGENLSSNAGTTNAAGAVGSLLSQAGQSGKDLTQGIMGGIQVQTILNEDSFQKFSQSSGTVSSTIALVFIYICVGVIFGLLAAMFFTVGIKFISRVIILWIVIIASPAALLMYALPNKTAQGYFSQWVKALFTYSIYPAIFLFLFIILQNFVVGLANCSSHSVILCAISDTTRNGTSDVLSNSFINIVGSIGVRVGFVMVLLYFAIKASSEVSSYAGAWAQKITAKPDAWAAGLRRFSYGAASAPARVTGNFAYRNTVGRGAEKADKVLRTSSWANSALLNNSVLGHPVATVREKLLQPLAKTSVGGGLSRTDYVKQYGEKEKARTTNIRDKDNAQKVNEIGKVIAKNVASGAAPNTNITDRDKSRIQNLTERELGTMSSQNINAIAALLTEDQIKKVEKMEKFNEGQKDEIIKTFNANSPGASMQKAEQALEHSVKMNGNLSSTLQIPEINKAAISGTLIDKQTIENISNIVEKRIVVAETNHTAAITGLNTAIAGNKPQPIIDAAKLALNRASSDLRTINRLAEKVKNLEEERKKIPTNVGGVDKQGEFIKK
jgi:hypothetical protein